MKNIETRLTEIITPRRFVLRAIYFGKKKPRDLFIYIHGLGGNMFLHADFVASLTGRHSAALTFNNRGFGIVNTVKHFKPGKVAVRKSVVIGGAHEVFTDCVDDIDGAVRWAKAAGAKNIYLIGHSTGCQKSIYYLSKRPQSPVRGVILLAPISDYSDSYLHSHKQAYRRALALARKMIKSGRKHELMPVSAWPHIFDAQRWLSLFTPDSQEEIFSYFTGRRPSALLANKKPVLAVLAEKDEFGDRPAGEIADWFRGVLTGRRLRAEVIKAATHGFSENFPALRKLILAWSSSLSR